MSGYYRLKYREHRLANLLKRSKAALTVYSEILWWPYESRAPSYAESIAQMRAHIINGSREGGHLFQLEQYTESLEVELIARRERDTYKVKK